jgi:hypothetical protein
VSSLEVIKSLISASTRPAARDNFLFSSWFAERLHSADAARRCTQRVHPGLNMQSYNYAHTFPGSLPRSLSDVALPFSHY